MIETTNSSAVDECDVAVRLTIDSEGLLSSQDPAPVRSSCICCSEPCLAPCIKHRQVKELCVSPMFYLQCVSVFLVTVLVINLLCPQATVSPLYGHTLSLPSVPLFVAAVVLFIIFLYAGEVRAAGGLSSPKSVTARFAKRAVVFFLVYALILPVAYWSANISLYHDGDEVADGAGTEFTFTASSGTILKAYRKTFMSASADSLSEDSIVHYPVVLLGGTGVNMYGNIHRVKNFLSPTLNSIDDPIAFDVFTFSYRGYVPNDSFMPNERNIIDDSEALWNYARSLYPANVRPLLFAHSLGTGPTSALLEKLGGSDKGPACAGLAMPFSSMAQCISELGFYTPMIFLYLIDSWRSTSRIKNMHEDVPLAILSAAHDELIAPHHQTTIFENANANYKRLLYSPIADHNDLYSPIYRNLDTYLEFMDSCIARADVS
ncbi:hypothetical protein TrCOL_g1306 [Triparma columacea]|uniref:Uncharacterized protein n=1 Tax=Triparma columacea TaxID=722753 RepID=A0A9W7GEM3_9STRA|nr:hypothetical protein TrCOL_g1306 [Triparma columacea]